MDEQPFLIFCNTFTHEGEEEDHQLDLVGFSQPIAVSEVRVIPNGCKVHPDIRDRLGETSPSSFKLEFFIKNLTQPNATVFERLGVLDYEEGKSIQLITRSNIPTNVVLLRGWYQNLTLCLYGNHMNFQDSNQIPPPPPMEVQKPLQMPLEPVPVPQSTNMNPIVGSSAQIPAIAPVFIQTQAMAPPPIPPHMEQVNFHQSPNYIGNQSPQEDLFQEREFEGYRRGGNDFRHNEMNDERDNRFRGGFRDNRERFEDDRRGRRDYYDRGDENFQRNRDNRNNRRFRENNNQNNETPDNQAAIPTDELFEPLSPESDFFEGSQEGANKAAVKKEKEIGYEDIESDEDLMLEDFDFDDVNLQNDFDTDEIWTSVSLNFNPYQSSLAPLENSPSITETPFEKSVREYKPETVKEPPLQVKQLQDYIVQDIQAERDAKWVTMLEQVVNIVPVAMAYLRSQPSQKMKEKHFLSFITEWAIYGLNMDKVRSLPLAVNIRFLKTSLKLTCLLANACTEYLRALIECDVHRKLIDLLKTSHVASSIKLLILKALDAATSNAIGMEATLGWNMVTGKATSPSVYEELLLYLLTNPTVRVVVGVKALLEKAHFYESLANMQSISTRISQSAVKEETVVKQENDVSDENESESEIKKSVDLDVSFKDVNDLLLSLKHIRQIIEDGTPLIGQRSLVAFPTTTKTQQEEDTMDDYHPTIIRFLMSRRFLESLLIIISSPLLCEPAIYTAIRDVLLLLLDSNRGLLYLSLDINTVNGLVRALLQAPTDGDIDYSDMPPRKQFVTGSYAKEQCHPHHLGVMIVYYLSSLKEIDQLAKTSKKGLSVSEMDSTAHITVLHTLYAMTFTPVGQDAVSSVLSYGDNFKYLLPFLNGDDEFESKMKKSVSSRYAAVLLNLLCLHSTNAEFYKKFGTDLLAIPKKENDKVYEDLHTYLSPLDKITTYDSHSIAALLELIKSDLVDFKYGSPNFKSVLVAMRLLDCIVFSQNKSKNGSVKSNLAVIQMFSSNAIEIFLQMYEKIAGLLLIARRQKEPLISTQCFILMSIVPYLLRMTEMLLTHLLQTTFTFKDNRLVQKLLLLHKTLCVKPPSGSLASLLTNIQEDIVGLLLKCLKGTTKAPDSEEAVKSSTWYILYKETLQFAVEKPENFISGLMLLSEFLPTPLPIHSLHEVQQQEIDQILNHRLFAIANLSFLGNELKILLKTVIGSCSSSLQYYLRRMCCQLVDLGAPVARLIIRCLVELVSESIDRANKDIEDNASSVSDDTKKRYISSATLNTFSLLSYLVCQPGGKIALLSLLVTTEECVTEFPDFIMKLITQNEKESDTRYLENNLLPFFQSICDHEICMEQFDGTITLQHLANSLPPSHLLVPIVEMLFNLLRVESLTIPIILRIISIIESLTDHDYGMQIIKKHLVEKGECLTIFLDRLIKGVKNKSDSPLVYDAISTFIEFLSLANSSGPENYIKPEEDVKMEEQPKDEVGEADAGENPEIPKTESENENTPKIDGKLPLQRKIFMNGNLLKKIFNLDEKNTSEHQLTKLEKIVEEESKTDEDLVSLSQAITTLRMIMIAAGETKEEDIQVEEAVELIQPESLTAQFSSRLVTMLINNLNDERASSNDWFDAPPPEDVDSDAEGDALKVDMMAICKSYLPNFNLKEELEKGYIDTTSVKRSKRGKHDAFFKAGVHIEDTKRLRFDVSALNTPPSMRGIGRGANRGVTRGFFNSRGGFNRGAGRGFGRGFGRGRGRGRGTDPDAFRQRRQNTSRPPSMHVDDFISMEKKGDTLMSHSKMENKDTPPQQNDRYPSGNFSAPTNANVGGGRWNNQGGGFRRPNDDYQQGGPSRNQRGGYGGDGGGGGYNQRTYYGGNKFHNRSSSDWNNSNHSYRGSRDNYFRQSNRGGYWNNQKSKDDNRFFSGGGGGYRGGRGNRHMRTFTR